MGSVGLQMKKPDGPGSSTDPQTPFAEFEHVPGEVHRPDFPMWTGLVPMVRVTSVIANGANIVVNAISQYSRRDDWNFIRSFILRIGLIYFAIIINYWILVS